jgi:hypothetical protein
MNIRREIANRRMNPLIQSTPVRKVPTKTHPRRANPSGTCGQREQVVDAQRRILVVRGELLGDLPLVAAVCVGGVVL